MKQQVTEIIFLLDRSGSMSGLERDTIGGFNALIEKQVQLEGETIVTTVLFDDKYEILWNGVDAQEVRLTSKEYFVRGTTALLDAVGKTILDVSHRFSGLSRRELPDEVLFVITTDGMENASQEFTYDKVQSLIHKQKKEHDWQFVFLGSNINVVEEASRIGIDVEDAFDFDASSDGVMKMYNQVNEIVMEKRSHR